jgi:hypothetical protein
MLFLNRDDVATRAEKINRVMSEELPTNIAGYATNFAQRGEVGVLHMAAVDSGPISHRVEIDSLADYLRAYMGVADPEAMTRLDWLVTPQQKLRTLSQGAVFHDGLGVLGRMQTVLSWYPEELWRVLLAAQWGRIGQEEAFPGRCAEIGDELGSRILTARLVRDLMRLFFLMERSYAPYSKWVGTAFSRLACAPHATPALSAALDAGDWAAREDALVQAYRIAAEMHNELRLTDPLPTEPTLFHGRPFRVSHGDIFASALVQSLDDSMLTLAAQVGAVDQWVDSTDVLSYTENCRRTSAMYAGLTSASERKAANP